MRASSPRSCVPCSRKVPRLSALHPPAPWGWLEACAAKGFCGYGYQKHGVSACSCPLQLQAVQRCNLEAFHREYYKILEFLGYNQAKAVEGSYFRQQCTMSECSWLGSWLLPR